VFPLYSGLYDGICVQSALAIYWVITCSIVMCVSGTTMIMLRSSYKQAVTRTESLEKDYTSGVKEEEYDGRIDQHESGEKAYSLERDHVLATAISETVLFECVYAGNETIYDDTDSSAIDKPGAQSQSSTSVLFGHSLVAPTQLPARGRS
jgi:hypothetical protein